MGLGFKEIVIIAVLMVAIWGIKSWNAERKRKARRSQRKRNVQTYRDDDSD